MRSPFALGLDFGTTNSALATVDASGVANVLPLPAPDGSTRRYWRTVLCFEPAGDGEPLRTSAGAPAIARYAASEGVDRKSVV